MTAAKIGIIGGSGLYQMPELTEIDEIEIQTPFGSPSDKFILGTLEGERVAFLPRHGSAIVSAYRRSVSREYLWLMKLWHRAHPVASAVGSFAEKYAPLDMVIPDQFSDRTRARARESTFFGEGIVAHGVCPSSVWGDLGNVL